MSLYYLKWIFRYGVVFIKKKLRPPRGALRGGGKHQNWGMGASAPIITSRISSEKNQVLLQVVFPYWAEDLDCHGVFVDSCRVLNASRDIPAVPRTNVRFLVMDMEGHVP